MVTSGLSIKLFDFQEKAVIKLIDLTSKKDSKQTIIMKAQPVPVKPSSSSIMWIPTLPT